MNVGTAVPGFLIIYLLNCIIFHSGKAIRKEMLTPRTPLEADVSLEQDPLGRY